MAEADHKRVGPMSDEAVEAALSFLNDQAEQAGYWRAQMVYMEDLRKSTLAKLKRTSPEKSDAAREDWARDQDEYRNVLIAKYAAIEKYEALSWKRTHAEATISAWQTKNANARGAGRFQ